MPLSKADYGDFSGNDPLVQALRQAMDFYFPGDAAADPRGHNVTEAIRKPVEALKLPPVRIDLEALAGQQAPKPDPLAMGQSQPPLPDGWNLQSMVADEVEPGSDLAPGVPIPTRGARPGLPEKNPAFHTMPGDEFMSPAMDSDNDIITTANMLAQVGAPNGGEVGPLGAEMSYLNSLGPIDRQRLELEISNSQKLTPEQMEQNAARTREDLLSVTPIIGNAMSAEMMFEQGDKARQALAAGEYGDAGIAALLAGLGGVGAVTGLPTGRIAGQASRGASSRPNVFAPVPPKDSMHDTAHMLYENAPRSYSAKKSPDVRNANLAKHTGTFFSPDGTLVREVDRTGRKLADNAQYLRAGESIPMGDLLEYPALYKSMPELADTPVNLINPPHVGAPPVARTAPGGFELTAGTQPHFTDRQLEKLLQYRVNEISGMSAAGRDAAPKQIADFHRSMDDARLAMASGALDQKTGQTYIRDLQTKLDAIETAQAIQSLGPNAARKVMGRELHTVNAGNSMAKSALVRMVDDSDFYPMRPGEYKVSKRDDAQPIKILPIADQAVLTQPGMDVMEIARMLANWSRYGGGQGK